MFVHRALSPPQMSNAFTRSLSRLSRRRKKRPQLTAIEEHHSEPEPAPIVVCHSIDTASDAYEIEQQRKRGLFVRGMDRLRRSIRHSLRRKKSPERTAAELVQQSSSQPKSELWQPDEGAVRAGVCSFHVKYLGAVEVFESRGMQVCEGALKLLRSQKRRPVKAVLYVSGDGLRVVDQENNRGLLVDQTIEKVSFCAPDRNNDRGFAYICRDGATRRWMCHGFQASKESGERLSHAVGCAFAVCLEKKKKRDEETAQAVKGMAEKALNPDWEDQKSPSNGTPVHSNGPTPSTSTNSFQKGVNPAYNSFRKVPMSERLQDPQTAIVTSSTSNPDKLGPLSNIAKPRPVANPQLFQRQGSLRAPEPTANFRRQYSLRPLNGVSLDSTILKTGTGVSLFNEPIYEGDEEQNRPTTMNGQIPHLANSSGSFWQQQQQQGTSISSSTVNSPRGHPAFVDPLATPSVPQSWINPESTGSSQNELVSINQDSWAEMNGPTKKKADDWLENALRNINISPTAAVQAPQPLQQNGVNGHAQASMLIGFTNYGSHYAPPPGNNPAPTPPPIPARPAISKDAIRLLTSQPSQPKIPQNVDDFGQQRWESPETVQWEHPPQKAQINQADDPFDVQWSQVALGQQVNT
ncbi:unnamed protein product, partial [Mesorhabditis belari]|uniref:PID domain-containing protein n=1 Tax=Mesorhabditis belari TaxID=2138241 RepID=A0AAF3FTM5_9BILA